MIVLLPDEPYRFAERHRLERLYRRRIPARGIVSNDLAREKE